MKITKRSESCLRIVVTGLIAQYPLGGVAWDYLQYPVGLAAAGHEVFYIEDTGQWPYDPQEDGLSKTCDFQVAYLAGLMDRFGLRDRWAYRFAWQGRTFGMSEQACRDVIRTADVVINVSGSLRDPTALDHRGVLCYIDTDPVFTQVKLVRGQHDFRANVDAHDVHFSFGEALSNVPETGHRWLPTRQPILVDEWVHTQADRGSYTTVMNWTSFNDIRFEGKTYGQKDVEFRKFIDLPRRTPVSLEVAMASGKTARPPIELLRHRGWTIVDPSVVTPDLDSYRRYVQTSRGEWSVAKSGYVVGQPGWFSCRSACYLAAGRPVVAEDTGFSAMLPTGEGLFAFRSTTEAAEAIDYIESDYPRHARAAREIAAEFFESSRVLGSSIDRVFTATRVDAEL